MAQNGSVQDIEKELQVFDESKAGVKGLVDAGITNTPPFFVVPESEVSCQPNPDHIGGLQVFHQDHWVDVPSIAGAFVANIGDLHQFMSSEHRVLANHIGSKNISCELLRYDLKIL
ncbi:hypothetical protein DKX38_019553 [Salix brachista]|uniref:Isopenicillin N synthase-like Fe(2+) 2OG dioxygenase domain-containing protein n=1 Tax=Salix brachista TaxID=2182728 RepID=A0A5N5KGJ0_9ROSI|nr:hypothetical protein DKX38_019553 [Salix brachista]